MKKINLDSTGKQVDGIDDQFEVFSRLIDYGQPCILGRIQLLPGMPLYHICALLDASRKNYRVRKPELQTTIGRYVLDWVKGQSHKLTHILEHFDENDSQATMKLSKFNQAFNNFQLSEFHLLLKHDLSRDVQYLFTSHVIAAFGGLLSTEFEFLPREAGKIFSIFERVIRKLFMVDPLLSKIKSKPMVLSSLNYIKYSVLHFEMMKSNENKDYIRAEIFANKASQHYKDLGQNRDIKNHGLTVLHCMLTNFKVGLAEKTNDMVMLSSAIQELISIADTTANDPEIVRSGLIDTAHLCQSFNLAELCFKMVGDFEKAHRCALESLKWPNKNRLENIEYSKQYHDSLTRLMSLHAEDSDFKKILSKVSSYPEKSFFLLVFNSEDHATYYRALLDKNGQAHQRLANSQTLQYKTTVALTINHQFNIDVYKFGLARVLEKQQKDEMQARKELERAIWLEKMNQSQQAQQQQDSSQPFEEVRTYLHKPSAVHKRQISKKGKKSQSMVINVPRVQFFEPARQQPLKVVHFLKSKKTFDPDPENKTGVVTLCVDHVPGRWYAIFNPRLIDMFENKEQVVKILQRFFNEKVLGNDLCVPCKKEMALKSLPYVFKIRLLGKNGNGDIRIYAHIIETLEDGKSLVAFSSINDKSHSKHTIPKLIDFPEELDDVESLNSKIKSF